jgi:hypothetical protein
MDSTVVGANRSAIGVGATNGFSISQGDTFCTASLVSITNSTTDPTEVTVVLNFTFNPGFSGTYSVLTQVNYVDGFQSPWQNVGTLTIQSPPTLNPQPTVTLTDTTQGGGGYFVGDSFTLTVTGPPNLPVSLTFNGIDNGVIANIGATGTYSVSGTWTSADTGNYTEVWYVDGVQANSALSFWVITPPDGYSNSFPSIPNSFTAPIPPVPCDDISGTWNEADDNGNNIGWQLQQSGNSIMGTLGIENVYYNQNGMVTCISDAIYYPATGTYLDGLFTLSASNPSANPDSCGGVVPETYTENGITLSPGSTGSCSSGSGSISYSGSPALALRLRPQMVAPSGVTPKQISGATHVTALTPRYNVSYTAYIPVDHVAAATYCFQGPPPAGTSGCGGNQAVPYLGASVIPTTKIYLGDANKGTYRATEALIVTPDAKSHGSLFYAPSVTRNYGGASPANGYSANLASTLVTPGVYNVSGGTYTGADEDNVPCDCNLWNNWGWANKASMQGLGGGYPTNTQANVIFFGNGANPLENPIAQIRWNMTVTIDDSNPNAPWAAVNYTLSCYPAHTVKVNGVVVYDSQNSSPKIPSSNSTPNIFSCLTSTLGQVTGSGPMVHVPAN